MHQFSAFRNIAVFVVAACATTCKSRSDAIVIGAYLSMTGSESTSGIDARDGIELAVEQRNQRGIHGRKVRVLYEDDRSTAQEASSKVRQLIDRDHVVALLGEVISSRSMVGGLIANTKKIPMVTPLSTAIEVTRDREYVFRTCYTDAQQGEAAATFAAGTLKAKTAGILYGAQDTYSSGLAQSFRDFFVNGGGKVTVEKAYQKGETNFTTYLREVKAARVDVVFVPVYYQDMVQIARQAKPIGLPPSSFIGADGWDSATLLEGAGDELEGAHFINHYAPDVPWAASQAFIQAFTARYRHPPNSVSAEAYDGANVLFDAIDRANKIEPTAIRDSLAATRDFAGATGAISIDSNHNAQKTMVVVQIHAKAFRFAPTAN